LTFWVMSTSIFFSACSDARMVGVPSEEASSIATISIGNGTARSWSTTVATVLTSL
jgi:hypothetical protein